MNPRMDGYAWPCEGACDALISLARDQRFNPIKCELSPPSTSISSRADCFGAWLESVSVHLGIEVDEVGASYADVEAMIRSIGPGMIRIESAIGPKLFVVLSCKKNSLRLLSPSHERVTVPIDEIRRLLCKSLEDTAIGDVDAAIGPIRLSPKRHAAASQAIRNHLLRERRISGCWTLRSSSDRGAWSLMKAASLPTWITCAAISRLIASGLFVWSWWLLGGMMLNGRMEISWLIAWVLALVTMIPFNMLSSLAEGMVAIAGGTLLKREVLRGAIAMKPDDVRQSGSGQLLGYVMESEIVESASLSAGFSLLRGALDFLMALLIFVFFTSNPLLAICLFGLLIVIGTVVHRYHRLRSKWTDARLGLTSDLIEKLSGHRTRQVQELRSRWNEGEDLVLEQYLQLSKQMDRLSIYLRVITPRLWLIIGLAALSPRFLSGLQMGENAVEIGGILLAHRAIRSLVLGVGDCVPALIAWKRIRPFWESAIAPRTSCDPELSANLDGQDGSQCRTVIRAKGLAYSYPSRQISILDDVDLEIKSGERVLLEGSSGSGKSTLAAILGGTRKHSGGLLLAGGLDRNTLGERAWGKKVIVAPQFHDNHVMSGTLAFNAMMGCDWPASEAELAETERVLRGLELGALLDRMPGGLLQTVGETGWQLSHGERSRLFAARALLQKPDLIVLDESFAALDPETLEKTMRFVMSESNSLMVIAHP